MQTQPAAHAAALLAAAVAVAAAAPAPAGAQGRWNEESAAYVRSHYSKFEAMIPMRDGVELFTAIYVPNDAGPGKRYPILLNRTPYSVGPYGIDRYPDGLGPNAQYAKEGFIFVSQDVRGRYMSEGEFVNMRPHLEDKQGPRDVDESTDTYDTIEWLLAHLEHHNGKVGQWGISYPGFYSSAGMIDSHPALVAVSPQAPIADWFIGDDMHHHGAFILPLGFNFFATFGRPRPEPTTEHAPRFDHGTSDSYKFFLDLGPLANADARHFHGEIDFWKQIVAHPNYDEFWRSRNILPHLDGITANVMVVGGWYDTEDLYGPLKTYASIEEKNPGIFNVLIMGPWRHGGWARDQGDTLGGADFGFPTSEWYRDNVELPFFRHFLKGGPAPRLPEALMFETGADRWRRFDAWPPPDLERRTLYLGAGGGLSWEPPGGADGEPAGGAAADSFVSDPAKPVPYTQEITPHWAREYMTEDQRFAARRPDVVVYETDVLDRDVTLAGPLEAKLWVSTTGGDADWIVKLIDVFPDRVPPPPAEDRRPRRPPSVDVRPDDGRLELVRAEVFRGRFRNSYSDPEPFVPGEVTPVAFELRDVLHTFKRGHRIMVQVQSTWFPFVDRNPQSWVPNIFEAEEDDFVSATHTVHRSADYPSGLVVGVLPGLGGE
jgi:hypothetical protein